MRGIPKKKGRDDEEQQRKLEIEEPGSKIGQAPKWRGKAGGDRHTDSAGTGEKAGD